MERINNMKNLLVTGGAGFIGANFVHYMLDNYPNYKIVNLDLLTYAGNIHNLDDIKDNPNHIFVHGNIGNRELVEYLVDTYHIDTIVNFAGESHVDRSIVNPGIFIDSNIKGVLNLLDITKRKGLEKYLQVSTDEVYGSLGPDGYFTEETPLAPNSPYSASKASADLLVRSYYETYGMNVNITRCSNNYGPYQFPEKLIPLMIQHGLDGLELPVYGDGKNIRDWLHVYDHCQAIDLVLQKGKPGEIYNIGGHNERSNNQIVEIIAKRLHCEDRIKYVTDRLGNDKRYAMDPTKIERTSHILQTNFSISWWAIVPIILMIFCAWRKISAIPTLFLNIAITVIMIFIQSPHESIQSLNNLVMNGFVAKTSDASVNALLTRGGISNMMATVALIISTLSLGGMLMKFNIVQSAMEPLVKHLTKPGRLITVTILSGICINLFVGEQYLSVILPGRAFKPAFDKIKLSPLALSRVLEDGGSVINYLIPWGVAGSFAASTLGVPVLHFLPFVFFSLLSPIFSILSGITGIGLKWAKEK